jgi:hypothetical protein
MNRGTLLIDLLGLVGLGGVAYGAWMIYPPSCYILIGLCLLGFAVVSNWK